MNDHPEQAVEIDLTNRLPQDYVAFCRTVEPLLARYALEFGESAAEADDVVTDVLVDLFHDWTLIAPDVRAERTFRMLGATLVDRRRRRRVPRRTPGARPRPDETPVGAPEDFVLFWGANKRHLTRYARRLLRSDHDAEDVVSEALFELYRCWDACGREMPHAVVYRIARSRAADLLRRRARAGEVPTDFAAPDAREFVSTMAAPDDPDAGVPDGELLDLLDRAVEGMPERRGACVRLHLQMRLPLQDVSVLLGVSASTVRTHIHIARQELRRALGPRMPKPTRTTRIAARKGNT
ncbi:RNA polymerase sigma factor [Embleya sp. NPDC127516]|uniref:RNA polymerase sigma factor n=1 Tax=Embleya sp. NPDC127516 TaxID=3363990 RepID=UPI003810070C